MQLQLPTSVLRCYRDDICSQSQSLLPNTRNQVRRKTGHHSNRRVLWIGILHHRRNAQFRRACVSPARPRNRRGGGVPGVSLLPVVLVQTSRTRQANGVFHVGVGGRWSDGRLVRLRHAVFNLSWHR
jgi:hypothetical protein